MERDEALALFEGLTSAPAHVAEHVLDAHGWDVNSAVEWYLESGGVGHGIVGAAPPIGGGGGGAGAGGGDDWGASGWEDVGADAGAAPAHGEAAADAAAAPMMRPADDMEELDDVIVEDPQPAAAAAVGAGARSARGRVASRPMPAAARPRSNPIDILDDDDDDIQVLATSLGRRRPSRTDELMEAGRRGMHRVGSVEEDLEVGSQGRRVRRNRRRVAGEVDRDLELLGQRFGVMDEYQPAPAAAHRQQQQRQGAGRGSGGGGAGSGEDDVPLLPDDVDLEEQRMLMAAIQGGGYEGEIPDFAADPRYQPRVLSPGAQERQILREEQDAAYYESLRADQEKAEAAERQRREEEEAAAAAAAAAEAEARQKAEAADRLAQELRWKAASLPPEPPAEDPEAVSLAVRLPAGGRYSRRFRRSDTLQSVFDFVDVQSGTESGVIEGAAAAAAGPAGDEDGAAPAIQPGAYSLATSYPRRILQDGPSAAGLTLAEAGITAKQEALFLEPK
ncbi:hypothetical protein ABPG77_005538 [Micractinium sp. CCAP 211/92]